MKKLLESNRYLAGFRIQPALDRPEDDSAQAWRNGDCQNESPSRCRASPTAQLEQIEPPNRLVANALNYIPISRKCELSPGAAVLLQ